MPRVSSSSASGSIVADEQLAVVSRRRVAGDRSAEHVGEPADQRAPEAEAPRAQEQIREQPAEEQMDGNSHVIATSVGRSIRSRNVG